MSKLSFRARALDASKPMPIFMAEELPDLPDYSAINRAVPQMPSGMTKEEECEHHLQRAICAGLIIPTPEVTDLTDVEAYDKIYPADYKLPRQLIHMQPFAMEQDIPDYDMDSDDEKFVGIQSRKMDLTPLQFEEMMDRLEKSCGQTVTTINEAKALLKEDDDLIIAVYDFWLNKRLRLKLPLQATVKTDHRGGSAAGDPYLAFRRITEKMQTRKNRKNDETSYEKMLKLRRDLSRAVTLLELVKRREKTKREHLHLTIEVYEKRYQAEDFSGQILSEVSALKTTRPAFAPLFTNQFGVHQNWANKVSSKEDVLPRKEKRQYKKRKHKLDGRSSGLDESGLRSGTTTGSGSRSSRGGVIGSGLDPLVSSDDDNPFPHTQMSMAAERDDEDTADEAPFAFRRNRYCNYLPPVSGGFGNWPWCDRDEGGIADKKYRFALTSISKPTPRCIGLARRRLGRGGRVILDRCPSSMDDIWSSLDFTIHESQREEVDPTATATTTTANNTVKKEWLHFRPKTPPPSDHATNDDGGSNCGWGMSNSSSSSSDDSESELIDSTSRTQLMPYPFPPEATSLCVDIEPDRPGDDAPFTSEFNISDYFSVDTLSDFDLGLTSITDDTTTPTSATVAATTTAAAPSTLLGSSRFHVTPLSSHVFSCRNQCSRVVGSGSGKSVNNSSLSTLSNSSSSLSTLSSSSSTIILPSSSQTSTTSSNQCVDSGGINSPMKQLNNQQNFYQHHHNQQRLFMNSSGGVGSGGSTASILSKSLTSPTSRSATSNVRVTGVTNFGNGHQNGPSSAHIHTNSLVVSGSGGGGNNPVIQNSTGTGHLANSQSTIILPQKHSSSSLLPGLIAQSKLASIARQQQQQHQQQMQAQPQQMQTQPQQQMATSGEITLNSNSEGLEMEVDGVEGSPCESKPQQQQLVRANKTNSLAMEVT